MNIGTFCKIKILNIKIIQLHITQKWKLSISYQKEFFFNIFNDFGAKREKNGHLKFRM